MNRKPSSQCKSHEFLTSVVSVDIFPSDDSEVTNPKKYRNAGLRKDWNAKPARPIATKSVLNPLPGLNDDDIKDNPPVQPAGRVAAGGSRAPVGPSQAADHLVFGFNQACFPVHENTSLADVECLQLAIATKAEHSNHLKPKVCD